MGRTGAVAIVIAVSAVAAADTAPAPWAVGVTDAKKGEANKLLEKGNALFLEKRYTEALAQYRSAVAAWDHPAIRFNIVRCLIQLDKPVEAAENLTTALRYGAAPLEEAVYAEALAYQKLLAKQVGDVTITCGQAGTEISLDGQKIAACPAKETRRLAPGKHQVLGTGPGMLARAKDVFVVGGEAQTVGIELEAVPKGGSTGIGAHGYGKIALVAGGGLLAIAGGLGLYAYLDYHAQFPDHCLESPTGGKPLCDKTGADRLDRARLFGDISTITAGVGGVAALAGVLVMWRYPSTERRPVVTASPTSVGLAVSGSF